MADNKYWRRIAKQSLGEAAKALRLAPLGYIVTWCVVAAISIGTLWYYGSAGSASDELKVTGALIGSAIVVLVLIFLWKLFRTPPKLHHEQQTKIENLEAALRPRISVDFKPEKPWVISVDKANVDGQQVKSRWFRVEVTNLNPTEVAKEVVPAITRIEYETANGFVDTNFSSAENLGWAKTILGRFGPKDIYFGQPQLAEVLSVDELHNTIHIKWNVNTVWQENLRIFDRHGTYRLTIYVGPVIGVGAQIVLRLHWDGNWQNVTMEKEDAI
jgi:hypothetical protein